MQALGAKADASTGVPEVDGRLLGEGPAPPHPNTATPATSVATAAESWAR
jgi:hypothetical protein